jgi:hypothetical protein
VGEERPLTAGECDLVASVFGRAIDTAKVRIRRRRWHPLQPPRVTMAPCGHIHFPPASPFYCDDFAAASLDRQGLFIHEMTHVWQAQKRGRFYLPLMRHPFCRYDYRLKPGWPLSRYGIEQQAEIVRHGFLLRNGAAPHGISDKASYEQLLDFSANR